LPVVDQDALADGGAGLQRCQVFGALVQVQLAHAKANRTGTDEDDFNSTSAEGVDLTAKGRNARRIQLTDTRGENAGS
jgi:hypothetical protein